jgi:phosphoribosyl 1,2-cyclic phosphate phosphodiesterase
MGLAENIEVRKRMLEMGIVDEKTIFLCNHFSHNGYSVVYEEFEPIAKKQGFLTSYDGMEFEL